MATPIKTASLAPGAVQLPTEYAFAIEPDSLAGKVARLERLRDIGRELLGTLCHEGNRQSVNEGDTETIQELWRIIDTLQKRWEKS